MALQYDVPVLGVMTLVVASRIWAGQATVDVEVHLVDKTSPLEWQ